MPDYTIPGVYIEELPSGVRPIQAVSSSITGFVGLAERGPLGAELITTWNEFQRLFGGYLGDQSYLAYAVEGFFINGGQSCYIAQVVGDKAQYGTARLANSLNVTAVAPGAWNCDVEISITYSYSAVQAWKNKNNNQSQDASSQVHWFNLTVEYKKGATDGFKEVFSNLSHEQGASNNAARVVNASSRLIRIWWEKDQPPSLPTLNQQNVDELDSLTIKEKLSGGIDDSPQVKHFIGIDDDILPAVSKPSGSKKEPPSDLFGQQKMGLAALATIDDISLLAVPDEANDTIKNARQISTAVIQQCEKLHDRFGIISADKNQTDISNLRPPHDSSVAAFYYPWIKVYDPSINDTRTIPPTGHIAGLFARTDIERGVHIAPANEIVRGALDLEFPVTQSMQNILNPRSVNCIRDFRDDGRGLRLWGARTMSSDPEWRYVNVRRLLMIIENSISEGTHWAVFEPNDEPLWATINRNVSAFLTNLWRTGALIGSSAQEAFFVRCDRTTMTQKDIDSGRMIAVIGIAPVKPAEFIIIRITQKTAEFG